jgi:hypothetical protein
MPETATSPFAGLKRKRLPGMHMITALDGGVPLLDALAAFFFMSLHDEYPHNCLIKKAEAEVDQATKEAIHGAREPDGMFMGSFFGIMASSGLKLEEWSYLPEEEVFNLYLIAHAAIEQTQRWIFDGVEKPYSIPNGNLVERPAWAEAWTNYWEERSGRRREAREYVERLRQEIEQE